MENLIRLHKAAETLVKEVNGLEVAYPHVDVVSSHNAYNQGLLPWIKSDVNELSIYSGGRGYWSVEVNKIKILSKGFVELQVSITNEDIKKATSLIKGYHRTYKESYSI